MSITGILETISRLETPDALSQMRRMEENIVHETSGLSYKRLLEWIAENPIVLCMSFRKQIGKTGFHCGGDSGLWLDTSRSAKAHLWKINQHLELDTPASKRNIMYIKLSWFAAMVHRATIMSGRVLSDTGVNGIDVSSTVEVRSRNIHLTLRKAKTELTQLVKMMYGREVSLAMEVDINAFRVVDFSNGYTYELPMSKRVLVEYGVTNPKILAEIIAFEMNELSREKEAELDKLLSVPDYVMEDIYLHIK